MRAAPSLEEVHAGGLAMLAGTDGRARVWFTNREGGVSRGEYASLNLAARVGDHPAAVGENRRRAATAAGFDPAHLTLSRQVHGNAVIEVERVDSGPSVAGVGDVLVTRRAGPVLGVLVADCVPVVLAGAGGLAVVHAGWRGLVAGALEKGIEAVGPVGAAWIGPSIHACCYEVGREVIDAFRARDLPVANERHVDPGHAAHEVLKRAGVSAIAMTDDCTSCDPRYFSYRRDGTTGRQAVFACLDRSTR